MYGYRCLVTYLSQVNTPLGGQFNKLATVREHHFGQCERSHSPTFVDLLPVAGTCEWHFLTTATPTDTAANVSNEKRQNHQMTGLPSKYTR